MRVLTDLVREKSGIELGPDKLYLVQARLSSLVRDARLADLDSLAMQLGRAPAGELARRAVEAVTINETLFFRDAACFEHLARKALPALRAARGPQARLRIWSAAASTGQEAYSIAITAEETGTAGPLGLVEIVATDISRPALERAEAAIYSRFEASRGLSAARLRAFFTETPEGWQVRPRTRAMVRCRTWNLLDDSAPLGRFDIILCRNVLIYFHLETRRRVLERIAGLLAPDGFLYLGSTETLLNVTDRLVPAPGGTGVFVAPRAFSYRSAS